MIKQIIHFLKLWPFHNMNIFRLDGFWWLDTEDYENMWQMALNMALFQNKDMDEAINDISAYLLSSVKYV